MINDLKLILLLIVIVGIASSCNNGNNSGIQTSDTELSFNDINMDFSTNYYDSVFEYISRPKLVALKEDSETMYSDLDKIIAKDGRFYILDTFGSRNVVSFDNAGNPITHYGTVGQGPGEYARPWDIDVTDKYVYILDSNLKKILKFNQSGEFVNEKSIPFIADAFHILDNEDILFCIMPDGEGGNRLCLTDSAINIKQVALPAEKGFVGGWHTNDIFRNQLNRLSYYKAPSDTLYFINSQGMPQGGIVFQFGSKSVPEEANKDFLRARSGDMMKGKRMLSNSPIMLANGYMAGTVLEDEDQYSIIFNLSKGICGSRKCSDMQSVFDIVEPIASDEDGNLICYSSKEYIDENKDYDLLPDSIKSELEKNNRILLIYPFSRLK